MLRGNVTRDQKLKARLESGSRLLQIIELKRRARGCPKLGWAIEQRIIDRELRELEEDFRQNPPVLVAVGRRFSHGADSDNGMNSELHSGEE